MNQIHALLQNLGRPDHALDDRGSLVFSKTTGSLEDPKSTSATAIVGHDSVLVRIWSAGMEGALEPHLEARWELAGETATLRSCILDGAPGPIDEAQVFRTWQDGVNRLGVRPNFQGMAPRRTPALTAARPSGM